MIKFLKVITNIAAHIVLPIVIIPIAIHMLYKDKHSRYQFFNEWFMGVFK